MIRQISAAAVFAALSGAALAQTTTVTTSTETVTTIGVAEGDGMEKATKETMTVTTEDGDHASSTVTNTADYDRYFDENGNPTYMPDVSFSLD